MINKKGNNWRLMLFFNISGDNFRGRYKTVKIVLFRVKFRRWAEDAEKLFFYSNTIKLIDRFISRFVF